MLPLSSLPCLPIVPYLVFLLLLCTGWYAKAARRKHKLDVCSQGQWIRVHPNPKRYPAAQAVDWAARVIHLDADVCVVNKPAGIPVQSHESNSVETVPRCLEKALGLNRLTVRLASLICIGNYLLQVASERQHLRLHACPSKPGHGLCLQQPC